jgi:hypothetical protein
MQSMACGNNLVSREGLMSPPRSGSQATRPPQPLSTRPFQREAAQAEDRMRTAEGAVKAARTPREVESALSAAAEALSKARRTGDRKLVRRLEAGFSSLRREADAKSRQARIDEQRDDELHARLQSTVMRAQRLAPDRLGVRVADALPITAAPKDAASGERRGSSHTLQDEFATIRAGGASRQQLGDFSEAIVVGLAVLVREHEVLLQHTPGSGPHGLDIQTVDRDGKVWAFEVKGTRGAGKRPRVTQYDVGRQTSAGYVADRSQTAPVSTSSAQHGEAATHQVGAAADQIGSLLVQVNAADNEISIWDVDLAGRPSRAPIEIYRLDDIAAAVDGQHG